MFVKVLRILNLAVLWLEKFLLVFLMAGMLVLGFMQVFSRFVLKSPISWSEELLTYSFAWASFLGASLAIHNQSHFSVDLLVKRFSPETARLVNIFVWIIVSAFSLFIVFMGWRLTAANSIQMMNILPFSMMWAYAAVCISGLFMFIHSLEVTVNLIRDHEAQR